MQIDQICLGNSKVLQYFVHAYLQHIYHMTKTVQFIEGTYCGW